MGHRWHEGWRARVTSGVVPGRPALTVLAAVALISFAPPAMISAGAAPRRVTTASPQITIVSPRQHIYPAATRVLVKFSCASATGGAACGATLSGTGMNARSVVSGRRVQLAKAGSYALRVTAQDRRGRRTTKTLDFAAERAVNWSGYTWFVRRSGRGGPSSNYWSDTSANVRLSGSDLVLAIAKDKAGHWTSAEVDNQHHLGYGTYRWVVASDLSGLDPYQVLGLFTYAPTGAFADEIDMEASRWGHPFSPTGSAAVWQISRTHVSDFTTFAYSDHPPYVHQFTWSPGRLQFLITDATGAVLLDWTVTSNVPTPSSEVPTMNYWRFHGVRPSRGSTVRIASFAWTPLR
jgi:hypothetical protein